MVVASHPASPKAPEAVKPYLNANRDAVVDRADLDWLTTLDNERIQQRRSDN